MEEPIQKELHRLVKYYPSMILDGKLTSVFQQIKSNHTKIKIVKN